MCGENLTNSVEVYQFAMYGVFVTIVIIIGLLGNALAIFVLMDKRLRSPTALYLISLAVYDSLVLITTCLSFTLPIVYRRTCRLRSYEEIFPYIQPILYPIALTSQSGSIYTTIAFTVERFVAVCRPLRTTKLGTISHAKKIIALIFVLVTVYNLPRWFQYETIVFGRTVRTKDNGTKYELEVYYNETVIGASLVYRKLYVMALYFVVMFLFPFVMLSFLNFRLISAVGRSRIARHEMNSTKLRDKNGLTVMLIAIVVVFLVCQLPALVDNVVWIFITDVQRKSYGYVVYNGVSTAMVVTNSAVNFIFYCLFGCKFRQLCHQKLFVCKKVRESYSDFTHSLRSRRSGSGRSHDKSPERRNMKERFENDQV